jgi:hypothetical protein
MISLASKGYPFFKLFYNISNKVISFYNIINGYFLKKEDKEIYLELSVIYTLNL